MQLIGMPLVSFGLRSVSSRVVSRSLQSVLKPGLVRFAHSERTSNYRERGSRSEYGSGDRSSHRERSFSGHDKPYQSRNRDFSRDSYGGKSRPQRGSYRGSGSGSGYGRGSYRGGSSRDRHPSARQEYIPELPMTRIAPDEATNAVTLETLNLHPEVFESIGRMRLPSLSSVQQLAIPPILEHQDADFVARAKTGTGKTLAFLTPIFHHLCNDNVSTKDVKAVIVAPTRDLATQIHNEIRKMYSMNKQLRRFPSMCLVGGTNFDRSVDDMIRYKPNIIVATPGRLLDIMQRYSSEIFKSVDYKVLDEADRLLEIGFKEDLEKISKILNDVNSNGPKHVKTMLFSATLDTKVQSFAHNILNKSTCYYLDTVDPNEPEAHERIEQSLTCTENITDSILACISHINDIEDVSDYKAVCFLPTVKTTEFYSDLLKKYSSHRRKLPIIEYHGQLRQNVRSRLVKMFRELPNGVLICTDVAARGLDFPNVTEVLQIGIPTDVSNYVHRIGRTARAGKEGKSRMFLSRYELPFVNVLKNEKGIEIANQDQYEPQETLFKQPFNERDLVPVFQSLISFYKNNRRAFDLRFNDMAINLIESYRTMIQDENAKFPITSSIEWSSLGVGRDRRLSEYFERTDGSDNYTEPRFHRFEPKQRSVKRNNRY